ncbi:MAG: hypothetical protein LBG15_16710 [Dysgonamonadaceae bacterium]|jgi:hypothetical protein|nr:hypothetical protein [Dysgonamonadaceae bacterium]
MKYNLFIKTFLNTYNILDVSEEELEKVVDCYNFGEESIFISGKKYCLKDLSEIQIFTFESKKFSSIKEFVRFCEDYNHYEYSVLGKYLSTDILERVGTRVTDDYIKDDYGYLKEEVAEDGDLFVDKERIEELSQIDESDFDYTKLIQFLKELNDAYSNDNYHSIVMLIRTIIDHVPPIFGKKNFADVCGSYGTRSFQESMKHLNSGRKIADSYLHTSIRNQEALPTKIQVDFRQDLDVLLQEIVRLNK